MDNMDVVETLRSISGQHLNCSLPSNVNSGVNQELEFLEQAKLSRAMKVSDNVRKEAKDSETQSLIEHDHLDLAKQEQDREIVQHTPRFTSKAMLQISDSGSTNVDDHIAFPLEEAKDTRKDYDVELLDHRVMRSQYNVYIQKYQNREPEEKKVDENGNAVQQAKAKKKKQTDKNVVVIPAEKVQGHKGEIINDVNKLMEYIEGTDSNTSGKGKSSVHKSKQLHKQHNSEDGGRSKKQRAHSSKGKEPRSELKKSNSLGEISTTKLDVFAFATDTSEPSKEDNKVVLRSNKPQSDRPKERRSWGNVELPSFQSLYNTSVENLETSDNWVMTKPKKKSKKRRNSISNSHRQTMSSENNARYISNRAPSPDFRGKTAFSMPHSERSNDSSDGESVHSLPIDGPISYADIAKNSDRVKEKKQSPEKMEKPAPPKEKSPQKQEIEAVKVEKPVNNVKNVPPDVHNIKSFPSIGSTVKPVGEKIKVSANPKKTGKVKCGKDVKDVEGVPAVNSAGDIQADLSFFSQIIQASERESIQLNAQMLPPDVPDVQTIEKMHFINRQQNTSPEEGKRPQNVQNATTESKDEQLFSSPPSSVVTTTSNSYVSPISSSGTQTDLTSSVTNCDSERTLSCDEDERPPVVILSGISNKEVPGLVFGFPVNEQLLKEDVCENFVARYVPPEVYTHTSHNHDKIVNYIGAAWESIVNSHVEYYTEDL